MRVRGVVDRVRQERGSTFVFVEGLKLFLRPDLPVPREGVEIDAVVTPRWFRWVDPSSGSERARVSFSLRSWSESI